MKGEHRPTCRSASPRLVAADELVPESSSSLIDGRVKKGPTRLFDGDPETEWAEAAAGGGIGEWCGARLNSPTTILEVGVGIGHGKISSEYGDLFPLNSRPRSVILGVGDWSTAVSLQDTREVQWLRVPSVSAERIQITILSTYPGSRWQDTSINTILIRGSQCLGSGGGAEPGL